MRLDTKLFIFVTFGFVIFYYNQSFFSENNFSDKLILFMIPLIWPGLAHGSLDVLIAKKLNIIVTKSQLYFFILGYLLISLFIVLLWIIVPNLSLAMFLIVSAIHFGISDTIHKGNLFYIEIFFRGLAPISTPIYFYNEEVNFIFSKLNADETFINNLINYNDFFFIILMSLLILFLFFQIINIKKNNLDTFIEVQLIIFTFYFFEPFIAFCLYFCFFHSLRHLLIEKETLNISFKKLIVSTIPITLISTIGIFLIYVLILQDNLSYLSLIFISLSALTVPHMLLINKYRIPKN